MKKSNWIIIFTLLSMLIILNSTCKKNEDPSNDLINDTTNNSNYDWTDGLNFKGTIAGEKVYLSDSTLNAIGCFGEIDFKWHGDSILRKYGVEFNFNNGYSLNLYFTMIGSHNDFDTINGCYKSLNTMFSKGKQFFLYDDRPLPKSGFYAIYYKRVVLDNKNIYYTPITIDFQDSIDFYLDITKIWSDVDTLYSNITQQIFFEANLDCRLVHYNSDLNLHDTIRIENSKLTAKFDQTYKIK